MVNEQFIIETTAKILALMVAIIGHEIMHGYVAYRYGDDTAKNAGRLSINPLVHIDLVGTVLLPAILFLSGAPFLFGWAKPVPIYMHRVIRNGGYQGAINVALAGIAYNFTLAVVASILLGVLSQPTSYFELFLVFFVIQTLVFNVVLGIFNLYPIPPLDGSQALTYFAMWNRWDGIVRFYESIERYGMVILLLLIATPLSEYFFAPIRYMINYLLP